MRNLLRPIMAAFTVSVWNEVVVVVVVFGWPSHGKVTLPILGTSVWSRPHNRFGRRRSLAPKTANLPVVIYMASMKLLNSVTYTVDFQSKREKFTAPKSNHFACRAYSSREYRVRTNTAANFSSTTSLSRVSCYEQLFSHVFLSFTSFLSLFRSL